jgi:hypothetical protein
MRKEVLYVLYCFKLSRVKDFAEDKWLSINEEVS